MPWPLFKLFPHFLQCFSVLSYVFAQCSIKLPWTRSQFLLVCFVWIVFSAQQFKVFAYMRDATSTFQTPPTIKSINHSWIVFLWQRRKVFNYMGGATPNYSNRFSPNASKYFQHIMIKFAKMVICAFCNCLSVFDHYSKMFVLLPINELKLLMKQ